jgi:hypothetical protein
MKVKVLELLTSFQIGGTERQVANLVRGLDSSRFDLRVACLRRFGELLGEIESLHVPVTEFRIGGKLYGPKTALEAMRLAQYLRRNRVQIVHTFGLYPNIFAVPVAKMAGVPIVLASIPRSGRYPDAAAAAHPALVVPLRRLHSGECHGDPRAAGRAGL